VVAGLQAGAFLIFHHDQSGASFAAGSGRIAARSRQKAIPAADRTPQLPLFLMCPQSLQSRKRRDSLSGF